MSKTITKRSKERVDLAVAIEGAAKASQAIESAKAAISRANALVATATETYYAAKEKHEAAKEVRAAKIIEAASSGAELRQDKTARDARIEEEDAADELEAAKTALEAVKQKLGDPEAEFNRTQNRLKARIDAVLAGEANRLIEETTELAKPLAEKIALMRFIVGRDSSFPQRDEVRRINSFQGNFGLPKHIINQAGVEADAWRKACDSLALNADAALPVSGAAQTKEGSQ